MTLCANAASLYGLLTKQWRTVRVRANGNQGGRGGGEREGNASWAENVSPIV